MRTVNTLFMLSSVDGKISTGSVDGRDVDSDFPLITGIKEGLHQYYDIEKTTDFFSLNTGRVFAKLGINTADNIEKIPVNFIIVDNSQLTEKGVRNCIAKSNKLFLVTSNPSHPCFDLQCPEMEIISYKEKIDFTDMFSRLKEKHGAERVTIQSGGTLNSVFFRNNLVDYVSFVFAPAIVGGKDTSTLVDGASLVSKEELKHIKALELLEVNRLENSYLHLVYKVIN